MKANRILLLCIVALIIVNVTLLLKCMKSHRDPHHPRELSLALGIKGKDALWVDQEFKRHIREKEQLLNAQKNYRYKIQLDQGKTKKNLQIYSEISRLQFKIDSCTFDHFIKVKSKCSKEQQKKLNDLVRHMIEKAGNPRPMKK